MTLSPDGYRGLDSTVEEIDGLYGRDAEAQEFDLVTHRNYSVGEDRGAVLSPVEGPDREARPRVHLEAHG